MSTPKNPREWFSNLTFGWQGAIPWERLPEETREYYIIEYDKRFVYGEPPGGGCGDSEVPPSEPL